MPWAPAEVLLSEPVGGNVTTFELETCALLFCSPAVQTAHDFDGNRAPTAQTAHRSLATRSTFSFSRASMADSVEAQIAAEQAARRKKDKSSQRTDDKASLSVKSASYDSDIYGNGNGSSGYDTSIAVGGSGGMDEDLDDSDRPVRLLDSCESGRFQRLQYLYTDTFYLEIPYHIAFFC